MNFAFPKIFSSKVDAWKFLLLTALIFCIFFFVVGSFSTGWRFVLVFVLVTIAWNAIFKPSQSIRPWHQRVALAMLLSSPFALMGYSSEPSPSVEMAADQSSPPWDIDAATWLNKAEKEMMRKAVHKILQDEPSCKTVIYGDKSVNFKNTYYISCERKSGELPASFNVWFTVKDIADGKVLTAPKAISEDIAREACIDQIKANVSHPSTLDIHHVTGYATTVYNNGTRDVVQTFTAKNVMNLKLKFEARCQISPKGEISIKIAEVP